MALANFSLPFGALHAAPWSATISPNIHPIHQLATNTNNLLYSPADHQQQHDDDDEQSQQPPPAGSDYYKNNPYAPPQQQPAQSQQTYHYSITNQQNNNNSNNRRKSGNTYLPPIPPPGARNTQYHIQQQQQQQQQQLHYSQQLHTQQQQQQDFGNQQNLMYKQSTASAAAVQQSTTNTRTYGEGTYSRYPQQQQQQEQQQQPPQQKYYNSYNAQQQQQQTRTASASSSSSYKSQQQQQQAAQVGQQPSFIATPAPTYGVAAAVGAGESVGNAGDLNSGKQKPGYPQLPPGFTRVQAGQGSRTQVHAVLDYDIEEGDEDYYDPEDQGEAVNKDGKKTSAMPTVTPIQGPIYVKNGTVPVVPLFSYPTINNGTFVQIPIWWTALSVALGLDVRGDIIKGVPCIKRFHQLFCPTAGNSYPIDKIERFIDDNKALMRRMYGDFEMNMDTGGPRQQTKRRRRRFIDEPDIFIPPGAFPAVLPDDESLPHAEETGESYFGKLRNKRQSNQNRNANKNGPSNGPNAPTNTGSSTGRLDACESKIEIVTPYWASNSAGKIRAIVNTQHFEQAIHQEICSKTQTPRCEGECGCEQKYKWHRLLAYDPDNDCKGIFMDWFLFPSCCVCRCNP